MWRTPAKINTVGEATALAAREKRKSASHRRGNGFICWKERSDSASLTNALEIELREGGRAWNRAMLRWCSAFMAHPFLSSECAGAGDVSHEGAPWDGPAAWFSAMGFVG